MVLASPAGREDSMTKFVLDSAVAEQLAGITAPIDLCGPDGRTLGHFVPSAGDEFSPRPDDQCPHSSEELARMRQQTDGSTLVEFWSRIGRP
jgi:hypothetical protein